MICQQCNKEFTPTHNVQKYCSKKCAKNKDKELNKIRTKKYRQSVLGKKTKKAYFQTDTGKIKRKESAKKYNNTKHGKIKKNKYRASGREKLATKKYRQSVLGKKTKKKYFQTNTGKIKKKESEKKYNQSDKGKIARKKSYIKKTKDPVFKLIANARSRLYQVLKSKNISKNNKTFAMVGCTPKFLKRYLEKQFHRHPDTFQPMNWKNHTLHGWHIDHKIPLDKAKTPEDVEKLMHYTNLQPMWAEYNIKKGNKII